MRPLLLGHRGTRIYAPENTHDAFALALKHGCDGFELDVRLSSDGVPVVVHDPVVQKHEVASTTLADLNTRFSVPSVASVLQDFAANAFINLELKFSGFEPRIRELIVELPAERLLVSSFRENAVLGMHNLAPQMPLGFICDDPERLPLWKALPITHLVLNQRLVDENVIAQAHDAGKKLFVWTVNDQRAMLRFASLEVDGIISDDTLLLGRTLGGYGATDR